MGLFGWAEAARARFYEGLATSLDAGLPVRQALHLAAEQRAPLGPAAAAMREAVADGRSLAEAAADTGAFSALEDNLLAAGERSGHLVDACERLGALFAARGRALEKLHAGLVYPAVLLHLAILLPPLGTLVMQGLAAYLAAVVPALAILWAATLAAVGGWTLAGRSQGARLVRDTSLLRVPFLGGLVRGRAGALYAEALGLLISAGIPASEALERAARSTPNEAIARGGLRAAERVREERCPIAEALAPEARLLPRILLEAIRTGEASGRLDETLERTGRALAADAEARMTRLVTAVPVVVYLAVAAYIGWTVVSFYSNLYGSLGL